MAVSELLKGEYNSAVVPQITYYRERSGKEVDVVMQTSSGIKLFEIKSGQTFRPDYSTNMKYLASHLPGNTTTTVIYDGESFPPSPINIRGI